MRQRCAGADTGRIRIHHVLSDVLGQARRLPIGAHQNATGPNCQQNVPEPLHTDAHQGNTVLHRHDNRSGPTQDEEFLVQNQQSEHTRKIPQASRATWGLAPSRITIFGNLGTNY